MDFIRKWILESGKKIRKIPKGIQENFWDSKSTGEQTAGMKREKNVRIYDNSRACKYFKERTWERAESCKDCDLKHGGNESHVLCSGYPFTNKTGYSPCDNGRTEIGKQLSLL